MNRLSVAVVLAAIAVAARAAEPAPYLTQPAPSPDGREIAFVSGGDIWVVPAKGGDAHLLVPGPAVESRPLYSPDGRHLAFISTRSGNGDIYTLEFASGRVERITFDDAYDNLSAWSRDGEWLYFSSPRDNVGNMAGVFRVRVDGGTPMPVSREDYRNHEGAAPSPDGRDLVLTGNGTGERQWWRNGHSNLETGALWLFNDDGHGRYRRITPDDARALWPMWSVDGSSIFYMSDRGGAENLWRTNRDGRAEAMTRFSNGRVLWPAISADGRMIAFARDFGLWTFDVASGAVAPVPVTLRGAASAPATERQSFNGDFAELAVSPDGKKLAFIVRGEVFAASSEKGGRAERVTRSREAEFHLAWAPDSRRLVYASERDGGGRLYLFDFADGSERALTTGAGIDMRPQFSPDGKRIAFVRDAKELRVLDLAGGNESRVAAGRIDLMRPLESDRPFAWSPDGRWIAWQGYAERMFRHAFVSPVDGGNAVQASFLANVGADSIAWSADGKALYFSTGQRTEQAQVARVDLVPRVPRVREAEFRSLFEQESPPGVAKSDKPGVKSTAAATATAKPEKRDEPVRIEPAGMRDRLSLLPIGLDVAALAISPDGKSLLLTAEAAGRTNLYLFSIDELADEAPVARQLTSSAAPKSHAQFGADGKSVYYLEGGRIAALGVDDGKARALTVSADLDVDFHADKLTLFEQGWCWLRDAFHDPAMNGVDWSALRATYAPRIAAASSPDVLRELLNLMIGELDASHLGVRAPGQPKWTSGRTGLRFERTTAEREGRLRVATILPRSPADVAATIAVGDVLVAVDGRTLGPRDNLDRLLDNTVGRETALRFSRDGKVFDVRLKPVDTRADGELAYRAWVAANRAYVESASKGRLGYVHMVDMSMRSLQQLYLDLDAGNATREGVVVDVRNNFGGFVNAYALDVLARRPYLGMAFRGQPTASARAVLGQRSLERPTVLLTNRTTLSDGEDFSEGYRRLGLGKIVGEPTAGWIIYTSNARMLDGSAVRLPFITVTTVDGQPMEMAPRPVDVPVDRPLGEAQRGIDSELDAAVRVLLGG
ncbi:MAG TPA: S41 family peptidase [Dokdonella sp.]|uniref:S41 family peptidase n=1 Tax=Dokdonella sp. TaxID=2291710 RepID=UPI0025C01160|nr:S41 family peptidase [Dokdonella sp.]MBX3692247.1 PD40 domain-containing protein [Dokdonella sp.]HNR90926.1 S41 family peptidase [Dokdonella sp.]